MTEHPESVIEGALIAAKILHVSQICLGIEQNKPDAIDTMKKRTAGQGIRVIPLNTFYPQGGEKQLIYSITGRTVPAGGLPMDVGCVVMNVATCAAVSDAVTKGHPLIERLVTVTGTPVREPGTWKLRIGTPVSEA